jgi:hypothetical protein
MTVNTLTTTTTAFKSTTKKNHLLAGEIKRPGGSSVKVYFHRYQGFLPESVCYLDDIFPSIPGWSCEVSPRNGFTAYFFIKRGQIPRHKLGGLLLVALLKSRNEFVPGPDLEAIEQILRPRDR